MNRRHAHLPFDAESVRPFLGDRRIVSVELLSGGKCNSNYKMELDDGYLCVARFSNQSSPDSEHRAMDLALTLVPVPTLLFSGDRCRIFSFILGKPLALVPEYSREAAKILAKIASVRFDSPGRINADGSVSPWPFGGYRGFVDQMLQNPDVRNRIGDHTVMRIRERLNTEADRIADFEAESRLVHGDFNPGNILIHDGRVSGVLDWEFALSGTPYMDIGNLLRNIDTRFHDDICAGLVEGGMRLPIDWKERARLADLSSHLEFLTSAISEDFKKKCVDRIESFLIS